MTPGEYVHKRRIAAVITIDEATADVAKIAPLSAPLDQLESGEAPITLSDAWVLAEVIDFDLNAIGVLSAGLEPEEMCRVCACTYERACVTDHGNCGWAEPGLCTACAEGEGAPISPQGSTT